MTVAPGTLDSEVADRMRDRLGMALTDTAQELFLRISAEREQLGLLHDEGTSYRDPQSGFTAYREIMTVLRQQNMSPDIKELHRITFYHPKTTVMFEPHTDQTRISPASYRGDPSASISGMGFWYVKIPESSFTTRRLTHDLLHELLHVDGAMNLPQYNAYVSQFYGRPMRSELDALKQLEEGANIVRTLRGLRLLGNDHLLGLDEALRTVQLATGALISAHVPLTSRDSEWTLHTHPYYQRNVGLGALLTAVHGDKAFDEVFCELTRTQ
jgi:hypothetical protein